MMRTEKSIKKAAAAAQSTDELLRLLIEVMLDLRELFITEPEPEPEVKPASIVEPPPPSPESLIFVEDLPLSTRTKGALLNANYKTLEHLAKTSVDKLRYHRGLGVLSINEIGALLEEMGFKLTGYPLKK